MDQSISAYRSTMLETVAGKLKKNNFNVSLCTSKQEASRHILSLVPSNDTVGIGRNTVPSADKLGHGLAYKRYARALGVGSSASGVFFKQHFSPLYNVSRKNTGRFGTLQQSGIFQQAQHLPHESNRLLLKRLRISDVTINYFFTMFFQLLRPDNYFSPHGIVGFKQVGIYIGGVYHSLII